MGCCSSSSDTSPEQRAVFNHLMHTPFAHRLTQQQLTTLARYFDLRRYNKNEDVFCEQDTPGGDFYIIVDGEVDVIVSQSFLCCKTIGDTLGMSCTDASTGQRIATVTARTNVTMLQFTEENMEDYLRDNPDCRNAIMPLINDSISTLSNIKFFECISSSKLLLLGNLLRIVSLLKDDILFEEGSLGSSLFIVLQGSLDAVVKTDEPDAPGREPSKSSVARTRKKHHSHHSKSNHGHQSSHHTSSHHTSSTDEPDTPPRIPQYGQPALGTCASLGPIRRLHSFTTGDVFGEIALIMDIPRTASIVARKDCLLLELQRDSFQKFLKLIPSNIKLNDMLRERTAEHFRKYKVPFFEAIPEDKYHILASLCKIEQIPANQVIFKEGDIGNSFYIIAHGEMKVSVRKKDADGNPTGDEIELTRMGPGKYFGEIALVQDTPRTATVTTVTRCVTLSITKTNFQKFFHLAPEAIADFEVKLARYDVQLRSVIYHPVGLEYFAEHLKLEFSSENIEFWKEVRDFRHLTYIDVNKDQKSDDANDMVVEVGDVDIDGVEAEKAAALERQQLLDIDATFIVFSGPTCETIDVPELQKIMELLGVSSVGMDVEHVAKIMGANNGRITRRGFCDALMRFSQINRDKGRASFSSKLLFKMHRAIHDVQMSRLYNAFQTHDIQQIGMINEMECGAVFRTLGVDVSENKVREAFRTMDQNGDGKITFAQFVEYWIREKENKDKLRALLVERAQHIVDEYICNTAPSQVNIKGPTQQEILDEMKRGNITQHLFDRAEEEILKLMSSDSFARFKQSNLFQEFLDQADSYRHVSTNMPPDTHRSRNNMTKVRSGSFRDPPPSERPIKLENLAITMEDEKQTSARGKNEKLVQTTSPAAATPTPAATSATSASSSSAPTPTPATVATSSSSSSSSASHPAKTPSYSQTSSQSQAPPQSSVPSQSQPPSQPRHSSNSSSPLTEPVTSPTARTSIGRREAPKAMTEFVEIPAEKQQPVQPLLVQPSPSPPPKAHHITSPTNDTTVRKTSNVMARTAAIQSSLIANATYGMNGDSASRRTSNGSSDGSPKKLPVAVVRPASSGQLPSIELPRTSTSSIPLPGTLTRVISDPNADQG